MKIVDIISILKAERIFRRTPSGRPITEYALESLDASIDDEKNWQSDVIKCSNCCIIQSSLLFSDGCPNCGLKQDLTINIITENILKGDKNE